MRTTKFLLATLKETPADAEVISHKLMLRSGMIRKLASGLYTWLPLGLRVLRKVEAIIREEMNKSGAQEVLMPVVQPAELWEESGRWQQYGPELLRISDRHERPFCLGPTHEEVITDLVRNEVSSYKQLPLNLYQIQTKFRDEIRPRFGIMRSREFIMKDAYSFHASVESLQETYDVMHQTYSNIFSRIGLDFRPVLADTGSIGGNSSHEFHVLAESGEDAIAISSESAYAANVELAEALPSLKPPETKRERQKVATPHAKTIEEVAAYLKVPLARILKTLIVEGESKQGEKPRVVALILRGDHTLNAIKAEKLPGIKAPLTFANPALIAEYLPAESGSLGPLDLNIPIIADRSALSMQNFVCGANETGFHYIDANWNTTELSGADIRNVVEGDPSPCGQGQLLIKRGIEVGHIFQLGNKYSSAMKASVQDENGKDLILTMGCYGIGVTRVVASAIEQNHDDKGIIWPASIAPFQVALIPINMNKSPELQQTCEELYKVLLDAGMDVLFFDESKARLGAMLADAELIGIPHRLVLGERGLKEGVVEYRHRAAAENEEWPLASIIDMLTDRMSH